MTSLNKAAPFVHKLRRLEKLFRQPNELQPFSHLCQRIAITATASSIRNPKRHHLYYL
ncbi:hypothetical protein HanXRQr2_Chr15g0691751 [Helianthus annuus]|uniref:Uncharacterized protein n=1 Tax=Helianthus annuus TaxID=4232 RepID=A0A251S8B4_HELAN|nr:hypothetical protein HanXRQr2_Chr15g0691751 [Helianthus annuus]KAJ0455494.1 hypothetical protein HanIR_Chr15g0751801 [Helianthus annuus]KAJ0831141.1 hypothetical protein HanPSC8_Chr15g0663591 [Helianthus annuus]